MAQCVNCQTTIGSVAKILPVIVDRSPGVWEVFCPDCFVFVRVPQDPNRFRGQYESIYCANCGYMSAAFGMRRCGNCGGTTRLARRQLGDPWPPEDPEAAEPEAAPVEEPPPLSVATPIAIDEEPPPSDEPEP